MSVLFPSCAISLAETYGYSFSGVTEGSLAHDIANIKKYKLGRAS